MKKIAMVTSRYYERNRMFDLSNPKVNRDNCMYPSWLLKTKLAELGYDLSTSDINSIDESEWVFYNDMPERLPRESDRAKSILFAWESPLIRPDNFDPKKQARFKTIFTYDDRLVDGERFLKLFYTQAFPSALDFSAKPIPEKMIAVIAGNKSSDNPLELYSERVKAVRWFEAEHPGELDLYGFGWNEYQFKGPKPIRALNRLSFLKRAFAQELFPSFRGKAANKFAVYSRYRFALCYENIRETPGYITEKIIDALCAGCVPIYWGAPNVAEYIPSECFIDKRDFSSFSDLYSFLKGMPELRYRQYLTAISRFFSGEKVRPFMPQSFAENVVTAITRGA
jgi:alpha(1,3/1,4) fucosyltransferase